MSIDSVKKELSQIAPDLKIIEHKSSTATVDEAAIIHKSNKILDGEIHLLKEKHQSKEWIIKYSGNQMSFTNAIWGGWKMINHSSINEKIHLAAIELTNDLTINKFIKGIVDHVEIIEINKKLPTMNDVFIKATLDE